ACYLRPLVLRGYGNVGVLPTKDNPIETYVACWEWGKYLGDDALSEGVDVCVSSWTRIAPNTLPALAKAGANYMNSQLIRMEAHMNGYSEGIALDNHGYVSEGSGENIFLVRDGKIMTATSPEIPARTALAKDLYLLYRLRASGTSKIRCARPLFNRYFVSRFRHLAGPPCGKLVYKPVTL